MSESATIEAAIELINARFTIDENGGYFLRNTNNEEYVNYRIGELHSALMAEGHMPMIHRRTLGGGCSCGERHDYS